MNELTNSTEKAITEKCSMKEKNRNRTNHKQPVWKCKTEKEIEALRGQLSILEDLSKGINVKKIQITKWKWYSNGERINKTQSTGQGTDIRKIWKRTKFNRQNKIFKTNAKKFYREMRKQPVKVKKPPSIKEIKKFRKKSGGMKKNTMKKLNELREGERTKETEQQKWEDIHLKEVAQMEIPRTLQAT